MAILSALPASAQPVTLTASNGTLFTTTGISSFVTLGSDMDGMLVTANFANNTSQTLAWTDVNVSSGIGGVTGGAGANFWRVWCQGNSSNSGAWFVYNNTGVAMTSLVLNGAPGRTIFDRTNPNPGTLNSASGGDFTITTVNPAGAVPITVLYTNILRLNTDPPVGDEYTLLRLTFTGGSGLSGNNKTVRFSQDTDNATSSIISSSSAPEPGSLALVGLLLPVLGGVAANRRRRGA